MRESVTETESNRDDQNRSQARYNTSSKVSKAKHTPDKSVPGSFRQSLDLGGSDMEHLTQTSIVESMEEEDGVEVEYTRE